MADSKLDPAAIRARIATLQGAISSHEQAQRAAWAPQPGTPYGARVGYAQRGAFRGRGRGQSYRNHSITVTRPAHAQPALPHTASRDHTTPAPPKTPTLVKTKPHPPSKPNASPRVAPSSFSSPTPRAQPKHFLDVEGIRFEVTEGGTKLVRTDDAQNQGKQTPQSTLVAGVPFVSSRSGNLIRQSDISAQLGNKNKQLCHFYTTTGICNKGSQCPYTHDPNRTAICKDYLSGKCTQSQYCNLSHESCPNNAPHCLHFMRGNCNKDKSECKYTHVSVNPSAPVCTPFATLGWCDAGETCAERHVWECPEYSREGVCLNKKCKLPHVQRAVADREKVARAGVPKQVESASESASESEPELARASELDSDDEDMVEDDGAAFDEQEDFVKL